MTIRFWYIPAMIALIALMHFAALWSGFYDWQFSTRVIWFDNVLHALVGIAFAMALLWYLEYRELTLSRSTTIVATLLFVLTMAVVWELAEYIFFTQLTDYAYSLKLYSPSLGEALSDIMSDIVGATAFLIFIRLYARSRLLQTP